MEEKNKNVNPVEQAQPVFSSATAAMSGIFKAIGNSLLVRGVIMVLFGLIFWVRPIQVMNIIITIIGLMLLIDCIPLFISSFNLKGQSKAVTLIPASIMLILGLLCTFNALGIARIGIVIIGIWQLISGIQSISTAKNSGSLGIVSALLSILVGVILVVSPIVGLLAYTWLLALCIIVSGISSFLLGLKLRGN